MAAARISRRRQLRSAQRAVSVGATRRFRLAGGVLSETSMTIPACRRSRGLPLGTRSRQLSCPFCGGRVVGALGFARFGTSGTWPPEVVASFARVRDARSAVSWHGGRTTRALSGRWQRSDDCAIGCQAENVYLRTRSQGTATAPARSSARARRSEQVLEQVQLVSRHRLDGAAARRNRHRQGAVRHADSRAERPPCAGRWCA